MTTLWVLLHVAAQRDYELHSLDFSTAFLQGCMHEEIWLRRPPGFTGTFLAGTQWSLYRPVYGLRQAPSEWHDTLRTTLAALGFTPSTADPSLFLHTDTPLPPLYVLVYVDDLVLQRFGFQFSSPQPTPLSTSHLLSAPPLDESVEPSGPYPELVGCLITSAMGLVLGGRGPVVLTGHADASLVDDSTTQRSSQGYTFSLGATLAHLLADRLGRATSFASSPWPLLATSPLPAASPQPMASPLPTASPLLAALTRDDATLARFTSLQGPGAGAWVSGVPAHSDLTFTAAEWGIAAAIRLGLPIQQLQVTGRCVCGTTYNDPADPHHALRCKHQHGQSRMHDEVKFAVARISKASGGVVIMEDIVVLPGKRVVAQARVILLQAASSTGGMDVDLVDREKDEEVEGGALWVEAPYMVDAQI
ncbi:unnamed protein product [Closterium sp. NIES-54]